eukprot:TRINITY_DN47146_c0_g1_i1.p2 TRINITY_DN47146_c0_g1~~TRINITY_DN47146_c0_g1_i1.p2  ORF type:complete len:490 (+),score=144.70 TRINITY_DN47146_c0_g1_i1:54-1523(+)
MPFFEPCFVPPDFTPPRELKRGQFVLRPLTPADVEKDFEAVTSSAARLRTLFARADSWPRDGITLEENAADLARHAKEFELGLAFAYTVFTPDNQRCLGSVYVNPATKAGYDAELLLWVRDEDRAALEPALMEAVGEWMKLWPFKRVCTPGLGSWGWDDFERLPWRDEDVPRICGDAVTVALHNARASGLAPETPSPQGLLLRDVDLWLHGVWERSYIARAGTGARKDSGIAVLYVQKPDGPFCDLRVSTAPRPAVRSPADCGSVELCALADAVECFAGATRTQRVAATEPKSSEKMVIWHAALHSDPLPDAPAAVWGQIDSGLHPCEDIGRVELAADGHSWMEHGVGDVPEAETGITGYLEEWRRARATGAEPAHMSRRRGDGSGLVVVSGGYFALFEDNRASATRQVAAGRGLREAARDESIPVDVRRDLVCGFECSVGQQPADPAAPWVIVRSSLPWLEQTDARPRLEAAAKEWEQLGTDAGAPLF